MRVSAGIVIVVAGMVLIAAASAQEKEAKRGKQESAKPTDRVKELQQERVANLKTLVEMEAALLKTAKTTPEAVLEAKVSVCEAELEAAENDTDRIVVLKSFVDVLKELEETAKARKAAAEATEVPVLKAKSRRLQAEIRLEQLQAQPHKQANNTSPRRELVVVTRPQVKDVVVNQQFAGQIRSRRHIEVRSQLTGYLEDVAVKEGQAVKKGDLLFRVMPQLHKAKLDIELAELQLATLNLKNSEKLFQNKLVSQEELAVFKAKLDGAQAKAELAQAELELTAVRAPFDGIVNRLQQQGSLVTQREVLTTLSDNSVMWVYFNVPQASYLEYVARPEKDQPSETQLVLADGRMLSQHGQIGAIEAQFDESTGCIPFRADFPNPEGLLRHGMSGNVLLRKTLKDAIVIPQRATFEVNGERYVYVVDKDDVARRREIIVQQEQADTFVLKQGLDVNDKIVLEGVRQIEDGEILQYKF